MNETQSATGSLHRAVAPAWHTAIVVLFMLGFSFLSWLSAKQSANRAFARVSSYVLAMVVEWAVVGFIWFGVRRRGIRLSELVGGSWARFVAILRDFAIAVGFLLISSAILSGLGYLLKAAPNQAIRNIYPQGPFEITVYLLLVLTAAYCEEVIFRGYMQRQFTALTNGATGGIVLQGIVFGASHGYQGWRYMLIITVFGILFGLLAQWRRTLRPGMIAHFLQDGIGGIAGRYLH